MRVLLVEDDPVLASAVRDYLTRDGCAVDVAPTLAVARGCVPAPYAAVVLDLGLPDGSGLSLLPAFARQPEPPAVLVLTAQDRLSDRVRGLDAGADDYLVKPFDLPELSARLRAIVRRRAGRRTPTIERGAMTIDPAAREVSVNGRPVELTAREYALVVALAEAPERVFSRAQLEDTLYTFDGGVESNIVEVYVSRLRRKFGRAAIRTVRGVGYRWDTAGATGAEADA